MIYFLLINLKQFTTFFAIKGNNPKIKNDIIIFISYISFKEDIFEICDPALTYKKTPGNIPKKETMKYLEIGILVKPNNIFIMKKGKIGTTLKKNK